MPLSKVQLTYIEARKGDTTPDKIAKDLGVTAVRVKNAIKRMNKVAAEAAATPAPTVLPGTSPARPKPKALEQMIVHPNGAVVMTPAQAMADDSAVGAGPFANVQTTEAQRTYILANQGKMSVEQIAKDTGLLPVQVQQIVDNLNPALLGREKFYERHRQNLHKIRPDEPFQ